MSLRYAVMGLLVDRSGSGYDLMQRFDRSLGNVWAASQSQLYGELNRLADNGRIEVTSEGPRGRKEYALTDLGRAELQEWLSSTEGKKPRRNEMLLQVFFFALLSREQAVERLQRQAEVAAEEHAALVDLSESVDWNADSDVLAVSGQLAMEYGLRLRTMEQEWAQWAIRKIAETNGTNGEGGAGSR
ncbi:PadR family transcriptional regulator [Streptomyces sp. 150FB]|uniref:PadR family transcriptional regulator n=1 Tax=Streptomyces sp. 150FB TaxID=1576605 RepID=UPI000697847B|nr:PadR family transcriptional regulator [Streptomyces sp. 150FB]